MTLYENMQQSEGRAKKEKTKKKKTMIGKNLMVTADGRIKTAMNVERMQLKQIPIIEIYIYVFARTDKQTEHK